MADGNLDWTTVVWAVGGLFVAFWVLRRLFRGLRRLLLLVLLIGGAIWLTGTGDDLLQLLSESLGAGDQ